MFKYGFDHGLAMFIMLIFDNGLIIVDYGVQCCPVIARAHTTEEQ